MSLKAVIRHSSGTVPLPYTLPGTTPYCRSLTWPSLLSAFTFSSAWLASEKQRPAPSPTLAFLLSIVGRPVNTSPRLWLRPGGLGQNLARQIAAKRKGLLVFLLFPLFFSSWLIVWLRPTREDSLKRTERQCSKKGVDRYESYCTRVQMSKGSEWTAGCVTVSHCPTSQKQPDFWFCSIECHICKHLKDNINPVRHFRVSKLT